MIDVRGLSKRFGAVTVVDGLDLQVARGSIFGFLGPNGSGKTTSIRMLCGLLTPDAGSGTCLGFDVLKQTAQIKRRVGYMTQKFSWWEDLSIEENLIFCARMYALDRTRERVNQALETLGLASRRKQLAGTLSGGWKQRLALAGCMLHEPELLLLDEPTAGVDPKARREFWVEIHDLCAKGLTVLVSTHYMDEAERCHRLAYIAYGKKLVEGTPLEVLASVGLSTYQVVGLSSDAGPRLRSLLGVDQAVPFGTVWHLSGTDAITLARSVEQLRADGVSVQTATATLEDAFIHLMRGTPDNVGGTARVRAPDLR